MAVRRPVPLSIHRPGPAGLLARHNLPLFALGAAAIVLGAVTARDVWFPAGTVSASTPTLYTVAATNVTSQVSGTGSLVPAQQLGLGFKTAGQLTEVAVRSGDHVKAGQVLARQDPSNLQLALQQAQASLASAQANLANTLNGTALAQAQHSLDQARQAYASTQSQVSQVNANDAQAVAGDQLTLSNDQATLSNDQGSPAYQTYVSTFSGLTANYNNAVGKYGADGCGYPPPAAGTCANDYQAINTAQADLATLQSPGPNGALSQGSGYAYLNPDLPSMARANNAVAADNARVGADTTRLGADSAKQTGDLQSGQRSLDQASNSVTNAVDQYNTQALNRPATLQQQQAAVASAQAQASTAQANLDATTLTAPIDALVIAVTAQAGDTVGAVTSSGGGSQAPGTTAPLPTTSTGGGTGGAFLTLIADGGFQAVVSFAESDAARIAAGQAGTTTYDAVSGLTTPVHVLAVAASPTTTSGVVNYYVTLTLDTVDPRLKSGLTANAVITTARALNTLAVPNSALTRRGNTATVIVLKDGKRVVTPVTLGVIGDTSTQVLSGLTAGDKIVLPTTRSTTTSPRGTGLGTGGGAIGVGGGGRGAGG